MQIVVLVAAVCMLLGAAAALASLIDRRAGWNRIPLELDSSREVDELDSGVVGTAANGAVHPL